MILAVLTLLAVLLNFPLIAGVSLIALLVLLVFSLDTPVRVPVPRARPVQRPAVVASVTRQLSSSLSIGQVANIVLNAALKATGGQVATLAMPVEVDHFMTIQLRQGQETVQMFHRNHTGNTLIEQVLQQGRTMFNRDRTAVAVVLRHEYLVIGVLCVANHKTLSKTDADLLSQIAVPAAISLHKAQLLDEQQYQINTLSQIRMLTLRLAGSSDRDAVAQAVMETTRDLLGVQEVALYRCKGEQLDQIVSLHRDRFSRSQTENRLTQEAAEKTAASGTLEVIRQPVISVGVPIEREGEMNEILAVTFIEQHILRRRELNTLILLASQTVAHLNTVELHEHMRAVSERLRVTINSARDGVLLFDREGKLIECNPAAERLLGIDKEPFLGKHFVDMLFNLMKDNELNGLGYSRSQLTELARQLRLEPNRITRRQFEQTNDGKKYYIEEIGSPVIDGKSRVIGRLLVLRDMTEQRLLADFRDEITHMAVHDLRGPLTAVINGIDMTLKLGVAEFPEESERVLGLSLESAHSLMRLINSLLDIARLESRRIPINPQPIAVADLVGEARQTLENSIHQAQIEVEVALGRDLPKLHVDQDLMRRVLVNLIDNAVRFTPTSGKVLIACQFKDHRLTLQIADSGPGIPADERDQIFEQYRQSKKNKPLRGSKGTGLGLTFCKLAVEAHGGRIWVDEAKTLPGACFNISLPIAT
ncbi:MAG: PAS domain-containing protein [Anaerolineae bacterium]|nr:PAS domain-containing protein [Anaerolineae bacterium]